MKVFGPDNRKAVENRLAEIAKQLQNFRDDTDEENQSPEHAALVKEQEELWAQLDQVHQGTATRSMD